MNIASRPAAKLEVSEINSNPDSLQLITHLLEASDLPVCGALQLPSREPVFADAPSKLHSRVREIINQAFPAGLYSHQAEAISASLDGEDVCQATSTASGKSLSFITTAMHELLSDPHARVLVLYPARALIQDQLAKWSAMLSEIALHPGFIDGGVPVSERNQILLCRRVVLMTPDVAQAWFMNHLNDTGVAEFRKHLRLLILDEAHVYDGVFGTNMAFFLRRLRAVTSPHRLMCSTATLGVPEDFIYQLTGRHARIIGPGDEGGSLPPKTLFLARRDADGSFDATPALVRSLAQTFRGRFLVFADSRKAVEMLTAASHRQSDRSNEAEELDEQQISALSAVGVMPYRSGYEAADRARIQDSLAGGDLRGIISTSALELGLDIGEIDLVVLVDPPASMKSFWQRLGRAGRRNPGTCIIIDTRHAIDDGEEGLLSYLARPLEPNWLYLHNRYAQYTNALCAASEIAQINGTFDRSVFESLPAQFQQFLENELAPAIPVAPDLYPLKQAAAAGPHREFPLRNGVEKSFKVSTPQGQPLGDLSFSQAMREAYPGAVYYYMATPYRVRQLKYRDGQIIATRERHYRTHPIAQVMVFPDFQGGLLKLFRSSIGFLAEAELQVSERVTGFKETRGSSEQSHDYKTGSPYSQQPLQRLIRTSGVCWHFPQSFAVSESLGQSIMAAFCARFGIQTRDIGIGRFHSRLSPFGTGAVSGICLFDNANGSLRLTERLAESFNEVLAIAIETERKQGNDFLGTQLQAFAILSSELTPVQSGAHNCPTSLTSAHDEAHPLVTIIASGEKAIYTDSNGSQEVTVLGVHYTPRGLHYHLAHPQPTVRWTVSADSIEPIHGITRTLLLDLMTGEQKAAA